MRSQRHSRIIVTSAFGLLALAALLMPLLVVGQDTFDRQAMLRSIVDNVIFPDQVAFIEASDRLADAASQFVAQPAAENLTVLQSAWRETSDAGKSSPCSTWICA